MSTKKKILTAALSLAVIVVVAVVSVVITLAATQTSVSGSFSITYTALNVNGTVTGSYTVKGSDKANLTAVEGTNSTAATNVLTFSTTGENEGTGSFTIPAVTLTETNNEVVYEFVFTSTDSDYTVTLGAISGDNLTIEYSVSDDTSDHYQSTLAECKVTKTQSKTVKIKFTVKEARKSAGCSSALNMTLKTVA